MKKKTGTIIPRAKDPLVAWSSNISTKLPVDGLTLGLAPAAIASIVKDANAVVYIFGKFSTGFKSYAKQVTAFMKTFKTGNPAIGMATLPVPPDYSDYVPVLYGAITRLSAFVKDALASPQINAVLIASLNLNTMPVDVPLFPEFTIKDDTAGKVMLAWIENGYSAIRLQMKREGDLTWTDLGIQTNNPYIDTTPLAVAGKPEVRYYRLAYSDKTLIITVYSPQLQMVALP